MNTRERVADALSSWPGRGDGDLIVTPAGCLLQPRFSKSADTAGCRSPIDRHTQPFQDMSGWTVGEVLTHLRSSIEFGRSIEVPAHPSLVRAYTNLPEDMVGLPLGRILAQTWATGAKLTASNRGKFVLDMAVPIESQDRHIWAVLDALSGIAPEPVDAGRDLAVVRDLWQSAYGGPAVRERGGGVVLRYSAGSGARDAELIGEPCPIGCRLAIREIAGGLIEEACAPTLHRWMTVVNDCIGLGGAALAPDGAGAFCVALPHPVAAVLVEHGTAALVASDQRFGESMRAMAFDPEAARHWDELNKDRIPEAKGGEKS